MECEVSMDMSAGARSMFKFVLKEQTYLKKIKDRITPQGNFFQ